MRLDVIELVWLIILSPVLLIHLGITRCAAAVGHPIKGGAVSGIAIWSFLYLIFGVATGNLWQLLHLISAMTLGVLLGVVIGVFWKVKQGDATERPADGITEKCAFYCVSLLLVATVIFSFVQLHRHDLWMKRQRSLVDELQAEGAVVELTQIGRPWWLRSTVDGDSCFALTVRYSPVLPAVLSSAAGKELYIDRIELEGPQIDDADLVCVQNVMTLRALSLTGSHVTNNGLHRLRHLESLQYLDLSDTLLSDDGIQRLSHFTRLETLILTRTHLTNRCMPELSRFDRMQYLDLSETQIDGDGLRYISRLGKLKSFSFKGNTLGKTGFKEFHPPALVDLCLDGSQVTDIHLAQFGNLSTLENLTLRRTQVTATGIKLLGKLPNLTNVWAQGSAATPVSTIQGANSKLRVQ